MAICAICGKSIANGRDSIDHVIPQALYKWIKSDKLYDIIYDKRNLAHAHTLCNVTKGCYVPSLSYIHSLHISQEQHDWLIERLVDIDDEVQTFKNGLLYLIEQQNGHCALCGTGLSIESAAVRRLRHSEDRNFEGNAVAYCFRCASLVQSGDICFDSGTPVYFASNMEKAKFRAKQRSISKMAKVRAVAERFAFEG